jgi:hypothetical protein
MDRIALAGQGRHENIGFETFALLAFRENISPAARSPKLAVGYALGSHDQPMALEDLPLFHNHNLHAARPGRHQFYIQELTAAISPTEGFILVHINAFFRGGRAEKADRQEKETCPKDSDFFHPPFLLLDDHAMDFAKNLPQTWHWACLTTFGYPVSQVHSLPYKPVDQSDDHTTLWCLIYHTVVYLSSIFLEIILKVLYEKPAGFASVSQ